jgi:hypothetical protein
MEIKMNQFFNGIEYPEAYEAAIKRNIITNAQKTWSKNTPRSAEIQNALNGGRTEKSYSDVIVKHSVGQTVVHKPQKQHFDISMSNFAAYNRMGDPSEV